MLFPYSSEVSQLVLICRLLGTLATIAFANVIGVHSD